MRLIKKEKLNTHPVSIVFFVGDPPGSCSSLPSYYNVFISSPTSICLRLSHAELITPLLMNCSFLMKPYSSYPLTFEGYIETILTGFKLDSFTNTFSVRRCTTLCFIWTGTSLALVFSWFIYCSLCTQPQAALCYDCKTSESSWLSPTKYPQQLERFISSSLNWTGK